MPSLAQIKKQKKRGGSDLIKKVGKGVLSLFGLILESALTGAAQGLEDAVVVYGVSKITGQDPHEVYSNLKSDNQYGDLSVSRKRASSCSCRCVNGNYQPLCSAYTAVKPVCEYRVCPPTTSSYTPNALPSVVPGTRSCQQEQVYNYGLHRYEWKTVCR